MAEQTPFLPPFFPPEISSFCGTSIDINPPMGLKWYFRPRGEEVFDWVISSDLLPLNKFNPDIPTLLHRSSPDIFFVPFSLTLSCSWEALQDLGSAYLPILLSVSLSLSLLSFAPTSVPLPSTFRKLVGMTLLLTLNLTVLLQRNTRLFPLTLNAALITSLTLNAAKFPFF